MNGHTVKKAVALFNQGWRLYNWGAILTDTHEETYLYRGKKEMGYWADGVGRDTARASELVGLGSLSSESDSVLRALCELSEKHRKAVNDLY